jgi:hypothetical protein
MPDIRFDLVLNAAVIVSVATFVLGYFITEANKRREQRTVRRKYLLALCTEIQLNTEWLEKSIRNLPKTQDFRAFLQSGPANADPAVQTNAAHVTAGAIAMICYRPHLINNYLDHIFRQHVSVLADMPDHLIKSIINFYDKLDWIDLTVESVEKQSFASISIVGREAIVESLRINMHEALAHGTEVLSTIRLLLDPKRIVV